MFFTHQLNWLDPPHTSSCYMSRWVLNKEQREGSGGLLVAQDGFLPTHSKDRSFKKGLFPSITACIPWKVQTKLIAALPPMGQEALHLMHCTSQIVTPPSKNCLIQSHFLHFFQHIPLSIMLEEGALTATSIFQLSRWARKGDVFIFLFIGHNGLLIPESTSHFHYRLSQNGFWIKI